MKATCVDNFWYEDRLKEGEEYEVIKTDGEYIIVEIDSPFNSFNVERFKIDGIDWDEIRDMKERLEEIEEEIEDLKDSISDLEVEEEKIRNKLEGLELKI